MDTDIEAEHSFAVHHLEALDYFIFSGKNIEIAHKDKDWNRLPPPIRKRYQTVIVSGIIRSAAFLEATANEMLRRISLSEDELLPRSGYQFHPRLRAMVGSKKAQALLNSRKPTLEKFDDLLADSGRRPIRRDEGIGQQAASALELRHQFVHYVPEMLSEGDVPSGADGVPKDVRWSNPFDSERIQMTPQDQFMSSKLVEWTAESCFGYAEEFFDRLDIESDISPNAQPLHQLVCDENPARPYVTVLDNLRHQYR